jgi:hypothetical protein
MNVFENCFIINDLAPAHFAHFRYIFQNIAALKKVLLTLYNQVLTSFCA